MNYPIQGTAADMTKTAFIMLRDKILEAGYLPIDGCPVKPILMPHDEIVVEVHKDYTEEWSVILADCMEDAGKIFVKRINLRPKIDVTTCWKK